MSWGEEWAPEAPAPLVDLDGLLRHVAEGGGSDLHLTVGAPPTVRVRGEMTPVPGTRGDQNSRVEKPASLLL